jgi:hypothetical protein
MFNHWTLEMFLICQFLLDIEVIFHVVFICPLLIDIESSYNIIVPSPQIVVLSIAMADPPHFTLCLSVPLSPGRH